MMWQWKVLEITKGIIFVKMKDLKPFIIIMIGSLETLLIFLSSLSDLGSTQANRRRGGLPLEPVNAIFMTIDTILNCLFSSPCPPLWFQFYEERRVNLCHGGSIGDHVEKVNMDVYLVAH